MGIEVDWGIKKKGDNKMGFKGMWEDLKEIIAEKFETHDEDYGFDNGLQWVLNEIKELEEIQEMENEEIGENIRDGLEQSWLDELEGE